MHLPKLRPNFPQARQTRSWSSSLPGTLVVQLCLVTLILGSPLTSLATDFFHSAADNGVASSVVTDGTGQTIFLYMNGGVLASTPGTPCSNGSGDEVCGSISI